MAGLGGVSMLDDCSEVLSVSEMDACGLIEAAVALDLARGDDFALVAALQSNLELWVGIRTLVSVSSNTLPTEVKENLDTLSRFIAQKTFSEGVSMSEACLDTLIKINLQISEGLLEGTVH